MRLLFALGGWHMGGRLVGVEAEERDRVCVVEDLVHYTEKPEFSLPANWDHQRTLRQGKP